MEIEVVTIPVKELKFLIRSGVEEALSAFKEHEKSSSLNGESNLIKRADVAEMLGVSLPTVHSWMNNGLLPFHRIGSRVFFKKTEILEAMKQVKIRRKV